MTCESYLVAWCGAHRDLCMYLFGALCASLGFVLDSAFSAKRWLGRERRKDERRKDGQ